MTSLAQSYDKIISPKVGRGSGRAVLSDPKSLGIDVGGGLEEEAFGIKRVPC